MDRYQRVEKPRPESAAINENEIRITSQGLIRSYVSYAASLFEERRMREIVLKAMGQAISKAVAIAEFIKTRNPHLHQDTSINSISITDVWEPIEEGLVPFSSYMKIGDDTPCFNDLNNFVNQRAHEEIHWAPTTVEQPKRQQKFQQVQHPQQQPPQYRQALGQLNDDSYGRGRGRGGGRGRGWARGGYGGYNNNNQIGYAGYGNNQGGYGGYSYNQGGYGGYGSSQENGGWNPNWSRGGGRGRGSWNSRGGAGAGYGGRGGGEYGGGKSGDYGGRGGEYGWGRSGDYGGRGGEYGWGRSGDYGGRGGEYGWGRSGDYGGRGDGSGRSGGRGYGRARGRLGGRGRANYF